MGGDLLSVFKGPLKYLKFLGLWNESNASKLRIASSIFIHLFLIDLSVIGAVMYFKSFQNLDDFSEAFAMLPTFIGEFLKTINFVLKTRRIESLLRSLKDLIEFESWIEQSKSSHMQKRLAQANLIFKWFLAGGLMSCLFSSFVPFTSHKIPHKMWFPWDYNQSEVVFWVLAAYQALVGFLVAPVIVILDMLPAFFMSSFTGIFEELSDRLECVASSPATKIALSMQKPSLQSAS